MRFDKEFFGQLVLTTMGFVFLVWLIIVCASCKTTKTSHNDYQYTGGEYTHTVYLHDTAFVDRIVVLRDSVRSESESESETGVEFVPGGGTYNTSTGEMTGVVYVKTSEREKTLESRVSSLTDKLTESKARIEALQDSLSSVQASGSEDVHTETKAQNFWWIWLIVGLVGGAGTIIALKKIPYTKPLMLWL